MKATELIKELQDIIDKEQHDFEVNIYELYSGYYEIIDIKIENNELIIYAD